MPHIEEIREYWNLRANGFSQSVQEELETESGRIWRKIFEESIPKENADVLDDGTGAGFFPVILCALGHRVTAIDYSDRMVEQARARFASCGVEVRVLQMDAQNLVFDDASFDAVVTRNVLWNLDNPALAYSEIARVLRPGGIAIIDDGNMYLHHHDAEYAEKRRRFLEEHTAVPVRDGGLHGKYNTDNVDFAIIDRIAEDLPMSYTRRPQWDFQQLISLGFDDIRVSLRGGALPSSFTVVAKKGETPID